MGRRVCWWQEQNKARLGDRKCLGNKKSSPKEYKNEGEKEALPWGSWASFPPSSSSVQTHGRALAQGSKPTCGPNGRATKHQACAWHCARQFANLLTLSCKVGVHIPIVQRRRWRPGEIKEWLAHHHMASKERWPIRGPTCFPLQGLSEITGLLELQAPESQRKPPHRPWLEYLQ